MLFARLTSRSAEMRTLPEVVVTVLLTCVSPVVAEPKLAISVMLPAPVVRLPGVDRSPFFDWK